MSAKVALGRLVDRLEAHGLVMRRAGPVDRCVKRVGLTKMGEKLVKDMRTRNAEAVELIFAGIHDADFQAIGRS